MKKIIVMFIETKDENGEIVKAMSFENGNPQVLQSVVSLMRVGYTVTTSVLEKEVDEQSAQV